MPRWGGKLNIREKEEMSRNFDTGRIYMAEVMDVRNVSRSGDLLVYLIGSDTDKKDSRNWILASYASGFYGTTPYDANSSPSYEKDPQSFGSWFPMPCVGNFVFVFFPVCGAENITCYWFACPINPNTCYMIPGIPSSYTKDDKIPLCDRNDKSCCNCKKDSNTTTVNENTTSGNVVDKNTISSSSSTAAKSANSGQKEEGIKGNCCNNNANQKKLNENIAESEKIQAEYKPLNEALKRQGLDKDGKRGYSTAGAKREAPSMCYGIKTPLGNTFVMDDGWIDDDPKKPWVWNYEKSETAKQDGYDIEKIRKLVGSDEKSPWQREPNTGRDIRRDAGFRFRTRNGTQILIADEGTIYMVNNDGSCWVEITKNGFLEGYSKKGVSIASDGDINLHTKGNIYIESNKTIALKAKEINIETKNDINIANTPHINTQTVINASEVNALEGKINTFESKGAKVIGELAGVFFGESKVGDVTGMPESSKIKIPKINAYVNKKVTEEKVIEVDGQGYDEKDQTKTKTINTKVPTHEPYCGHCKTENKNNEKTEETEEFEKEYDSSKDKLDVSNTNKCNGCNSSTGSCNKSSPVTSCKGCSGVTNQINKSEDIKDNVKFKKITKETMLSEHFNVGALCASSTASAKGIENLPNEEQASNLRAVSKNILEKIIQEYGKVNINSGFRCTELNEAIKGAKGSQHCKGEAVDIEVPGVSNLELAKFIKDNLTFDQLILENATNLENDPNSGWVHVSFSRTESENQNKCFRIINNNIIPGLEGK